MAASLLGLSACGSDAAPSSSAEGDSSSPVAEASSIEPWLKPEDVVRFPQGMMACLKRDDLQEVIGLAVSGHKTKMLAYFSPSSEGGLRCLMLDPSKRFKILDAEANSPDLPDALLVEVVGAEIKQADHGAYALVMDKTMATVVAK